MSNVAAILTAAGGLLTVIGGIAVQVIMALRNGAKIDENTAVTKASAAAAVVTAKQIDEVHAATNVLAASASGTYKTLT